MGWTAGTVRLTLTERSEQMARTVVCECTLELKGLSSGELAQLAGRQRELVPLELQSYWSLRLGDAILTAGDVGQLGDLHHISTFR